MYTDCNKIDKMSTGSTRSSSNAAVASSLPFAAASHTRASCEPLRGRPTALTARAKVCGLAATGNDEATAAALQK